MIFHITPQSAWERAKQEGVYSSETLATEGFMHCSTLKQVDRVASVFFKGQKDLVILCIDPSKVQAEIRYEPAAGDNYPHIYGSLNLEAVCEVLALPSKADGSFDMPALPTALTPNPSPRAGEGS
jgi:uncharacterized protein (DUF952 family)